MAAFGKAGIAIDVVGFRCRDRGDGRRPLRETRNCRQEAIVRRVSAAEDARSLASCTFMPICLQGLSVRNGSRRIARARSSLARPIRDKAKDLIQMRRRNSG